MNCSACATPLDSRSTFCPTCGRAVDDPFIGQLIAGRYEIERRIAIGGFGSIYRAYERDRDRDVALKIVHRELAADANLIARFRREGEVLCKLRDPHSVQTFETGETPEGLPFIAMELLEGDTLLRLFHLHGRMTWRRVLGVARGICSALAEAHALGVVHRDLKPANIFITNGDFVKVLDFGIAKILASSELSDPQELTVMGTAVGTVEYMAPEQLMGGRADGRTDIYTVGVLAYELMTGRRPFNGVGLDLLTMQLSESVQPPSQVSPIEPIPHDVDELVLRCLAQDSEHRFADVHELARAIDSVLARHPEVVQPQVPVEPTSATVAPPMYIAPPRTVSLPADRPVLERTEPVRRASRRWLPLVLLASVLFAVAVAAAIGWLI